jgi:hypothetical protein
MAESIHMVVHTGPYSVVALVVEWEPVGVSPAAHQLVPLSQQTHKSLYFLGLPQNHIVWYAHPILRYTVR